MKKSKIILNFIAIVIMLIVLGIYLWRPLTNLLSNLPEFKQFILSFGILAPIIFIVIIALQVLFAPIPGQVAGLASGFLFGPLIGTIYSMIGLIIGSYIVFILSRKYGRPLVEKFVNQETLRKFDHFSSENGAFTLFLIYLLPVFPDDAISYIAGFTNLRIRTLVIISALGRLPGFIVLNLVGAGFASENSVLAIMFFVIFMILSLILFIYKKNLEILMMKIINKIKHKS